MKKIFILFFVFVFIAAIPVYAARNIATVTTYDSSQLVKTGEGMIYFISFTASSAGGDFIIYDALAAPTSGPDLLTNIKAEGSEAVSLDSHFQDYTKKPLLFETGLYLTISNGYVILSYE